MPESSPEEVKAVEVDEAKAVTEAQDVKATSAESSPSESKGEKSILESVKDALDAQKETPPGSDAQGPVPDEKAAEGAEKEGEKAADESDDLTEDELARLRPKTRKRIENLLADRTERDRKIAEITPKAEQFEKVVRFVEDAGLTKDEVNQGFGVMAALKNDPLKAYEVLTPIYRQLQQLVGDVLPEDLQTEVNYGRITEAHARELARSRSQVAVVNQQQARNAERQEQTRQQEAQQAQVRDVATKVSEWEKSKSKSDPDWKLKQPRVTEIIELEVARRQRTDPAYFPNPEEALHIAQDALDRVEKDFRALNPQRREIKPTVTDGASTRSMPTPKNALEAAKQGLARMSAG